MNLQDYILHFTQANTLPIKALAALNVASWHIMLAKSGHEKSANDAWYWAGKAVMLCNFANMSFSPEEYIYQDIKDKGLPNVDLLRRQIEDFILGMIYDKDGVVELISYTRLLGPNNQTRAKICLAIAVHYHSMGYDDYKLDWLDKATEAAIDIVDSKQIFIDKTNFIDASIIFSEKLDEYEIWRHMKQNN